MVWSSYIKDQNNRIHYNSTSEIFYRNYSDIDGQQTKELIDQYHFFSKIRGQAINDSLGVEYRLEEFIKFFLHEVDFSKWELFEEYIFSNPSLGFMEKKKTVERLLKACREDLDLSQKDLNDLIKKLTRIINDRNKFAHGKLILDFSQRTILLRFFENGVGEIPIDMEFFDTYTSTISLFNQQFDEIFAKFVEITPF